MYTKRGGRVQVNRLQFQELVERVERLEESIKKLSGDTEEKTTKNEVMEKLKASGIEFNPRDKKEVLESLLNGANNAEES